MLVDSALYRDGRRHQVELDAGTLDRLRRTTSSDGAADRSFVWVGLHEPDAREMAHIAMIFCLHPLAVEDALSTQQRPKVESYDDLMFLVLKTLWYVDERDEVETGQVSVFLGPDFVVTVRQGAGVELSGVRHDLELRPHLLAHGASAVVHAVCDQVVDRYAAVASALEDDVDEVEASVFSESRTRDSRRIYVLKREIAEVRRAVHPLRVPMQRFGEAAYPCISPDAAPFFRDVADHVLRVGETVDSLDALLSTAFDAHLARISIEQNEDMRRISAWVAIAAVGTLVVGIYGMNFDNMPELRWRYGYAWSLGLMAVSSLVLYRLFKRSGWL